MLTRSVHILLAVSLALGVSGCRGDSARTAGRSARPIASRATDPTPDPTPGSKPTPANPKADSPLLEDSNNPVLIAYCAVQDKIVTLEGQLISGPLPTASRMAKMRQAQRLAGSSEAMFRSAGVGRVARLASAWSDSFATVRTKLARGERPFDALRPAIVALARIEKVFTCQLDG